MNKNIFVIYPSGKLGDLIWHLPFIKHISQINNKKVIVITRKSTSAQKLLQYEEYIESVKYFEFKKGIFNYFFEINSMRNLMKIFNTSQVWILDKISRPAIAAKFASVNQIFGYGAGNQSFWITNKSILKKSDLQTHYIERGIKFFKLIGKPINYKFTNLNVNHDFLKTFDNLIKDKKIITYGVDSSEMWRSWPKEYFANLINKINEENKYIHILVAGPWNSNIAEEIINNVKIKNVFNYSHLHLSEVAALLKLSNIFIGNDSGILNLSAAVGTKSLGLFGATKSFAYSHNIYPVIAKEGEISKNTDRMLDGKGKTIKNSDFAKRVKVDDVLIAFYKVVNS